MRTSANLNTLRHRYSSPQSQHGVERQQSFIFLLTAWIPHRQQASLNHQIYIFNFWSDLKDKWQTRAQKMSVFWVSKCQNFSSFIIAEKIWHESDAWWVRELFSKSCCISTSDHQAFSRRSMKIHFSATADRKLAASKLSEWDKMAFSSQEGIFSSKSVWEMEFMKEERRWCWRSLPLAALLRWDVQVEHMVPGWLHYGSRYEDDWLIDWKYWLNNDNWWKSKNFFFLNPIFTAVTKSDPARPSFLSNLESENTSFTYTEDESVRLISWCHQHSLDVKGSSEE